MIKLIKAFAVICVLAFTFSCENCETCTVTVTSAGISAPSIEQEYCGDELDAIQDSAGTATVGGIEVVTSVDCN